MILALFGMGSPHFIFLRAKNGVLRSVMGAGLLISERSAAIRPHRSHRKLRVHAGTFVVNIVLHVVALIATYFALRELWPIVTQAVVNVVSDTVSGMPTVTDSFLGLNAIVPAPLLARLNVHEMLWTAIVSAILLVAGRFTPWRRWPLALWFSANLMVLLLVSLYAFFAGKLAYDGAIFMMLVERTSLMMILCAPIFCAFVTGLLPFSFAEKLGFVIFAVAFDIVISAVRLAASALLVARFGAIVEVNLYLFLGPLLDVFYFVSIYSLILVSLSRRISKNVEAWEWL